MVINNIIKLLIIEINNFNLINKIILKEKKIIVNKKIG